ncbi:NAD-P-binding protein [Trametes maxima]|nr:NAD-P-binding protein [Trametes maxima]
MSSDKVTIFYTGATGYIGGSVLQRLFEHPNRQNFDITALVRNTDKAEILEAQFSLKTVVGSLQDHEKLSTLAEDAHIVINTADCDDVDAMKAILRGMKARHDKTGDVPLLIHTSGAAELADDAGGEYSSDTIYSDLNISAIEALPPSAFHRPVTLLVVAADVDGYARTHVIMPSIIYGVGTGPLFDAGIANPHTIVVPMLMRAALQRGSVGILGKGASRWGNVHLSDTADVYIRLLDALLSSPDKVSHGREGYFFVENGEHGAEDIANSFAEPLFTLGRISVREPVQYTKEELVKYFGSEYIGRIMFTNARLTADRTRRELGWSPKHTPRDFLDGLKLEVESFVKKLDADRST